MTADHAEGEYEMERLRAALATDTRVLQQGLDVALHGDLVVVRGAVPTAAARDGVAGVVRDVLPGRRLVNDVEVTPNAEPGAEDIEDLA